MEETEIPAELAEKAREYRAKLIEAIAENDEILMNKYLEGQELSVNDLKAVLRKAVINNEIVPILTGSALKNKGVQKLLDAGCKVRVYDPVAMDECRRRIAVMSQEDKEIAENVNNIIYCRDMYDATLDAEALLLLTEWKEFRLPSWDVIARSMRNQLVLDGRNIFDSEELTDAGFEYHCIGR